MLQNKKVGFLGGGAMAEALLRGILKSGLVTPSQITVNDISLSRLDYLREKYQVNISMEGKSVAASADLLFFTVKPQVIHTVLGTVAASVRQDTLVISIAAGITLATLQQALPKSPVVRVMPNTPAAVGEAMSAIALGTYANEEMGKIASAIFSSVGQVVLLPESLLDAVTGLSGSGPGYVFVMIDALADAGVRAGLSRADAILLSAQTLLGAAKMVIETGEHPAKLRDMVTSPGGTTIAGIHVLEQQGIRAAISDAVMAATNRSRELGKK
ncbi:Pyrroline-5-carboxylate reductase [Propionispora sp. 2/2-37]|uniref:pyrroline-5-carboxylate reductase n=1 Tax=Propionispora sp. 2/2-37 TaxID=1677858 RepID=UPI0006BB7C5F|nr:pyrroline-5-carboxylate reductase [Propionispora sp. 2/2-37]CUH94273.1 Pyrroline-5-carboxylate reductase [Propionispora sp. 2/2-37]